MNFRSTKAHLAYRFTAPNAYCSWQGQNLITANSVLGLWCWLHKRGDPSTWVNAFCLLRLGLSRKLHVEVELGLKSGFPDSGCKYTEACFKYSLCQTPGPRKVFVWTIPLRDSTFQGPVFIFFSSFSSISFLSSSLHISSFFFPSLFSISSSLLSPFSFFLSSFLILIVF